MSQAGSEGFCTQIPSKILGTKPIILGSLNPLPLLTGAG